MMGIVALNFSLIVKIIQYIYINILFLRLMKISSLMMQFFNNILETYIH